MRPEFSVVIPTCNRLNDLAECLERLSDKFQTLNADIYELIVTDDGKQHPAERLVAEKFPAVRWTAGPARGPAANRNHGASLAQGQWLVFIDDDCLPENELLKAYWFGAQNTHEDVATVLEGPTLRTDHPPSLLWEAPHNPSGGAKISANFAIRARDFKTSGGFDERYPKSAFEDTEFFERFAYLGGVTVFIQQAIVRHPLRRITSAQSLASRWEGRAIYSLDQGASAATVAWRLPWHALRVIQSRFRNQPWSFENLSAALLFFREWIIVLMRTPGWVCKWNPQERSSFWKQHVAVHGPAPKYGF